MESNDPSSANRPLTYQLSELPISFAEAKKENANAA